MFDPSVNVLLSQYPIDYLADFVEIPLMSPAGGRGGEKVTGASFFRYTSLSGGGWGINIYLYE